MTSVPALPSIGDDIAVYLTVDPQTAGETRLPSMVVARRSGSRSASSVFAEHGVLLQDIADCCVRSGPFSKTRTCMPLTSRPGRVRMPSTRWKTLEIQLIIGSALSCSAGKVSTIVLPSCCTPATTQGPRNRLLAAPAPAATDSATGWAAPAAPYATDALTPSVARPAGSRLEEREVLLQPRRSRRSSDFTCSASLLLRRAIHLQLALGRASGGTCAQLVPCWPVTSAGSRSASMLRPKHIVRTPQRDTHQRHAADKRAATARPRSRNGHDTPATPAESAAGLRRRGTRRVMASRLRQQRHLRQPDGFGQAEHDVHVLHGLARSAFDQIVVDHQDDQRVTALRTMHGDAAACSRRAPSAFPDGCRPAARRRKARPR